MIKIINENKIQLLLVLISFALYFLFLANGLNFYDALSYEITLKQAFNTNELFLPFTAFGSYGPGSTEGLGRSSLYILLSYPYFSFLTKILGTDPDFALNSFSAIIVAISTIFVYRIARFHFNAKSSFIATLLYIITPLVFFLGINSFNYTLLLLFSSAWFYYLSLALKTGKERYSIISSLLLVADIFIHPISLPLLLPQAYSILKMKISRKFSCFWLVKHALAFMPVALLLFYFSFINPAYPIGFKLPIFIFTIGLFILEFINSLSLPFFIAFVISFLILIKELLTKKADQFDILFFLTLVSLSSLFVYWNLAPVVRFAPIFPLLSIFVVKKLQKIFMSPRISLSPKHFGLIILLLAIFMLVKFVPLAYQFHFYPHPHKVYAQWDSGFNSSLILISHECPWVQLYTNLNYFCRSVQDQNISLPAKGVYVTEEYYKNENQLEFEYMINLTHLPLAGEVTSEISRADILKNRTISKVAEFNGTVRSFEDVFQWLFSLYPNPAENFIVNTNFLKPKYAIYVVRNI